MYTLDSFLIEAQNAFWDSKTPFCTTKRTFGQNWTFGVILRPGSKGLLNKRFQEPFFSLWEPKTENELILALLALKSAKSPFIASCCPKVGKWAHFCISAPKVRKRSPETFCLISILSQGAKWTPKSDFGVQKRNFWDIWGPKYHFGLQNPTLGPSIAFWASLGALAPQAY